MLYGNPFPGNRFPGNSGVIPVFAMLYAARLHADGLSALASPARRGSVGVLQCSLRQGTRQSAAGSGDAGQRRGGLGACRT